MYTYIICIDGENLQRCTVWMWVMEMEGDRNGGNRKMIQTKSERGGNVK